MDPIIPLHRIFHYLNNHETMMNSGIVIKYANVTLENQQFEVFVEVPIVSSLKKSRYGYPVRNTTIMFGGVSGREVPTRPGWYFNRNNNYIIHVKGYNNLLNFINILGI